MNKKTMHEIRKESSGFVTTEEMLVAAYLAEKLNIKYEFYPAGQLGIESSIATSPAQAVEMILEKAGIN